MLFLAVFCGFLAEYQLEHKIEKDREKQYMKTLAENLKSDTAMFANNIARRKERISMIDSLIMLFNLSNRNGYGNDLYYLGRSISPPINIFPTDGTIQQLKSSGNLRLVRNMEISNNIMAYEQNLRNVLFEMGDEVEIRSEYRLLAMKVFNSGIFNEMIDSIVIARPVNNPALFNSDPELINELTGSAQYIKRVNQAQSIRSEQLLKQAIELLEKIQREYRLK